MYNISMFFVYVTFPSKREAKKTARVIIDKKLAGCVNIFPIESIYQWKNKIIDEKEMVAIFKTTKEKLPILEKIIKSLHSYEVPCIASIKISKINKEFQKWLEGEIK